MSHFVSPTAIAAHMAAAESAHPQVSEVSPVDADGPGRVLFTVTLGNNQRFRVTVEETD